MASDLLQLSLVELAGRIKARKVSSAELVQATLTRIDQLNPRLNCYITVMRDSALKDAQATDDEIRQGKYRGVLHGIPISLKDIFATKGVRTTAGSKVLRDWVPDYDAMIVTRLRRAGAVLIAKANQHEWSYGVTSNNPHFGPVRNPWNTQLLPGGSSGGSAAAVAADLCVASIGSDTGGSIRIPSSACGVTGLKPTYGRISRFGAVPLAWSMDHVGPIAKTAADAAVLLSVLAGADANDPTCSEKPVPDYSKALPERTEGLRIGWPQRYFFKNVDAEIQGAIETAMAVWEKLGARRVPVDLSHLDLCPGAAAHITLAEAASYHEPHFRKAPDDYGEEPRRKVEAGFYLLASDYVKSQRARTLLQNTFAGAFERVDVIVAPTLPAFPPRVEEEWVQSGNLREHIIDAYTRLNIPADLTGHPAISIPCGFSAAGLPIGLQLMGKPFDEITLLRAAHAYQTRTDWHLRNPHLPGS